jgi:hypothetical protein
MYVKIESELLRYLRFNQKKLRAEKYIHLRDAIVNNANAAQWEEYEFYLAKNRKLNNRFNF